MSVYPEIPDLGLLFTADDLNLLVTGEYVFYIIFVKLRIVLIC